MVLFFIWYGKMFKLSQSFCNFFFLVLSFHCTEVLFCFGFLRCDLFCRPFIVLSHPHDSDVMVKELITTEQWLSHLFTVGGTL